MRSFMFLSFGSLVHYVHEDLLPPMPLENRAVFALPISRDHLLTPGTHRVLVNLATTLRPDDELMKPAVKRALTLLQGADDRGLVAWCPGWPDDSDGCRRQINYMIGQTFSTSFPIVVWDENFNPEDFPGTIAKALAHARMGNVLLIP